MATNIPPGDPQPLNPMCLLEEGADCEESLDCVTSYCISSKCYGSTKVLCPNNDHEYFLVGPLNTNAVLNFEDAKQIAESRDFPGGGNDAERNFCYLAVLEQEIEQTCIENTFIHAETGGTKGFWLGGRVGGTGWEWTCPDPCPQDGEQVLCKYVHVLLMSNSRTSYSVGRYDSCSFAKSSSATIVHQLEAIRAEKSG